MTAALLLIKQADPTPDSLALSVENVAMSSFTLPTIKLQCNGKAGCVSQSFQTATASVVTEINNIKRLTLQIAKKANASLPGVPVKAITKQATKFHKAALAAEQKLPAQTDVCSL